MNTFPFFFHLLHAIEKIYVLFSIQKAVAVYSDEDFPWVQELEADWLKVRAELDAMLTRQDLVPNFQDVSPEQETITNDDKWKAHIFYAYGYKLDHNCKEFPETTKVLENIPGMKTALFSILSDHKHIPLHRGPYKGLLRCHLGLIVPKPAETCTLRIENTTLHWQEGKAIVFDDTYPHEVWNTSDQIRAVLFIDFKRPMVEPMAWLNETVLRLIVHSPYEKKL